MDMRGLALVFVAALCGAAGNVFMKTGIEHAAGMHLNIAGILRLLRQPAFAAGIVLTGAAGLVWFHILATQKLSTCYPLFVSFTYCLITLGAFFLLHEKLSAQKLAGLAVIVFGITLVARG